MDSTGTRHAGFLNGDDLVDWHATLEEPVSVDYRGHTVFKTGPWGQGPVFLQQLRLLEGFDLAALGIGSAELVHTVIEAAKLSFADREAWYGDPDFVDVPLELLLSEHYADERRCLIADTASDALRPGGEEPRLPSPVTAEFATGIGEPTRAAGDKCHVDVADRAGNLVSATPSGGWLWSSPVVPELGFPLGTRAQMFWLEEGLPNSLEPRKRPRTTLSHSGAATRTSPSARPGATSRISGRSCSFSTTSTSGSTCRRRSTRRHSTRTTSRARSTRVMPTRGRSRSKGASCPTPSQSSANAATRSS
jgi:gamma-glutamyltranspeptidase/glutathione hydrolase